MDIAEARTGSSAGNGASGDQSEESNVIVSLKSELASLQAKYTENHPDVMRLKETIARLEAEQTPTETASTQAPEEPPRITVSQTLRRQLQGIELEIQRLKMEIEQLAKRIEGYQTKIEETPKREQELISLNRDYDNLQKQYNSLLSRKLEADMAVSMEKKQKGEQFRVIDPANFPRLPKGSNFGKSLFTALVIGLSLGGGLAYLKEYMDSSYKTPEEAEKDLQIPVLINLPFRYTDVELRHMKWKNSLAYISVSAGFIISAVSIVLSIKGVDKTIEYIQNLMGRV
jgi:uncharacterized protein involved in exopolysaccharide biosynthesis